MLAASAHDLNTWVRSATIFSTCNDDSAAEHNLVASHNLVVYCNFDVMKAYMKGGAI